MEELSWLM